MNCATCDSDDLRRLQLLYEGGLTFTNANIVGGGFGSASGVGVASSRGTQRTALSIKFSPPKKRGDGIWYFWALAFALLAIPTHGFTLIFTLIFMVRGGQLTKWNRQQLPVLYANWQASFMCQRCGWVGVPAMKPAVSTINQVIPTAPPPKTLPKAPTP